MSKTKFIAEFIIKPHQTNNIIFVGNIDKKLINNFINDTKIINNNATYINITANDFLKLKFNFQNHYNILFIDKDIANQLFQSILNPEMVDQLDTIIFKNITTKLTSNRIIAHIKNIDQNTINQLTNLLDNYPHEFNYFIHDEFIAIESIVLF